MRVSWRTPHSPRNPGCGFGWRSWPGTLGGGWKGGGEEERKEHAAGRHRDAAAAASHTGAAASRTRPCLSLIFSLPPLPCALLAIARRPSTERFLSEIVPRRHADVSQLFWRRTGQTRPWQAWIPLTRSRLRWRLPWWSSPGTGDGLRGALHDVPRGGGRLCEALMSVCSNAAPQCAFARR